MDGKMSRKLVGAPELAEILGYQSPKTITRLATDGEIPGYRLPGGRRSWRFCVDEVLDAMRPPRVAQ